MNSFVQKLCYYNVLHLQMKFFIALPKKTSLSLKAGNVNRLLPTLYRHYTYSCTTTRSFLTKSSHAKKAAGTSTTITIIIR